MANYGNASLEERIERRRKIRRAKRRRQLVLLLIAIALVVGICFGVGSLFGGEEKEPVEVVEQEKTPETPAPAEPETTPAPEEKAEQEPVEEPKEEPKAEESKEETPSEETPTEEAAPTEPIAAAPGGNNPFSLGAVKTASLLVAYTAENMGAAVDGTYYQIQARLLKPQVDTEKPMVALTFDDGPSKTYGNKILDILEKNGARSTFFVLGELVEKNAAQLKRAVEMGCEIANHGYDHTTMTKLSASEIASQINKTSELVKNATGTGTTLVRTPGGAVNATVKENVNAPIISWSLDTIDWKSRNTDAIVKVVLDNVQDGDIILIHEIHEFSKNAAEIIVPELRKRGYQLVTVSELMAARDVELKKGKVYFSAYPKKKVEAKEETTEPKKTETTEE